MMTLLLYTCRTQQSLEPVCEDCKNKVLDCYRSNPGKSLNCSAEAKEYAECVERARQVRGRQPLWFTKLMVYVLVLIYREYYNPLALENKWTVLYLCNDITITSSI